MRERPRKEYIDMIAGLQQVPVDELTLTIAQSEVKEWALYNFGEQDSYRPLLGIFEELGEWKEAFEAGNAEKMRDALGDVGVYVLHYCSIRGWDASELWDCRIGPTPPLMSIVKTLSHSHLKGAQNIRGGSAKYDYILKDMLSRVLWFAELRAADIGREFLSLLFDVWGQVRERDWRAHPNNADKVAEAATLVEYQDALAISALDAAISAEVENQGVDATAFHAMMESKNPSRKIFIAEPVDDGPAIPGAEAHRNAVTDG